MKRKRETDPVWKAAKNERRNERRIERRTTDPEYAERQRAKMRKENMTPERYARKQAADIRRRHQLKSTQVEPIISKDIFERDNWICHLCGNPVDPTLEWPDPMSPSLDHIVPLANGGSHTEDNVACSHLRCNLSKQNHYEVAI